MCPQCEAFMKGCTHIQNTISSDKGLFVCSPNLVTNKGALGPGWGRFCEM